MSKVVPVRLTVNLDEWGLLALQDFGIKGDVPADPTRAQEMATATLHTLVCRTINRIRELFLNDRVGHDPMANLEMRAVIHLSAQQIAIWWKHAGAGVREELLERIGAVGHDFDGGYDVYSRATIPPGPDATIIPDQESPQ